MATPQAKLRLPTFAAPVAPPLVTIEQYLEQERRADGTNI